MKNNTKKITKHIGEQIKLYEGNIKFLEMLYNDRPSEERLEMLNRSKKALKDSMNEVNK